MIQRLIKLVISCISKPSLPRSSSVIWSSTEKGYICCVYFSVFEGGSWPCVLWWDNQTESWKPSVGLKCSLVSRYFTPIISLWNTTSLAVSLLISKGACIQPCINWFRPVILPGGLRVLQSLMRRPTIINMSLASICIDQQLVSSTNAIQPQTLLSYRVSEDLTSSMPRFIPTRLSALNRWIFSGFIIQEA